MWKIVYFEVDEVNKLVNKPLNNFGHYANVLSNQPDIKNINNKLDVSNNMYGGFNVLFKLSELFSLNIVGDGKLNLNGQEIKITIDKASIVNGLPHAFKLKNSNGQEKKYETQYHHLRPFIDNKFSFTHESFSIHNRNAWISTRNPSYMGALIDHPYFYPHIGGQSRSIRIHPHPLVLSFLDIPEIGTCSMRTDVPRYSFNFIDKERNGVVDHELSERYAYKYLVRSRFAFGGDIHTVVNIFIEEQKGNDGINVFMHMASKNYTGFDYSRSMVEAEFVGIKKGQYGNIHPNAR